MTEDKIPEDVQTTLEYSDSDIWKPCQVCGGRLKRVRAALFNCLHCGRDYISSEDKMRGDHISFKKAGEESS
ncbi:MAG TPA: hypothetical protein ENI23_14610 [bacterium]|nr:hypothetical protein [bacterium]